MKVKELIEALQEQDPEMLVGYYDIDYGWQEVEKPLLVKYDSSAQQKVLEL